ncbi:hypothetical protein BGZ52_000238, partial [Haplosporangium bisporale]
MVSENVLQLCQATETVSSVLAKDPTAAPGEVVKNLYGHHKKVFNYDPENNRPAASAQAQEQALKCGRWGPTQPSSLFLQAYADALSCLEADPMSGLVSPPLMGSHGIVPLTVIAPLADIMRHCSNMIVRAEREVFFITCSWSPSVAQRLVKDALIELSRRAGVRGQKVVVKMMYDKATAANAIYSHQVNKILPSGPEIPEGEEMTPYISSMTPAPVPMALVSRPPYGPLNMHNVYVPQNEAWLSCIRNAQRTIFIQTPNLNAAPLVPALAAALKRGIQVTYYICFGYNDAGEILPGQGGTNDQAAQALVESITAEERQRLHICYYVGKDQDHPIHQSFKQRSCHIKLLIVDEH